MVELNWPHLLNPHRVSPGHNSEPSGGEPTSAANQHPLTDLSRSEFERDHGRIIFSNPFRRLHAKTQVFPVPDNDHVHSRLTHSIEVAEVGRTLGLRAGHLLHQRHGLPPETVHHVAQIVSTACLAHDLGNPPFGHAGEQAIGQFFATGAGRAALDELPPENQVDFLNFEGNAQGFRLLTRLCMYANQGGMRLTAAVLGTFSKYPQSSAHRKDPQRLASSKKFGAFHCDLPAMAATADHCGIPLVAGLTQAWHRHPLAFLMEAADDICYHILDLEDGVTLGLIDQQTVHALLAPILDQPVSTLANRDLSALRAQSISVLVEQVCEAFADQESRLLSADPQQALCDTIPAAAALKAIATVNRQCCYRAPVVLGLEQAGYTVIGHVLGALLESLRDQRNPHLRQIIRPDIDDILEPLSLAERLHVVTDFVSGMTDRYAVRLYRQFTGIELTSVR